MTHQWQAKILKLLNSPVMTCTWTVASLAWLGEHMYVPDCCGLARKTSNWLEWGGWGDTETPGDVDTTWWQKICIWSIQFYIIHSNKTRHVAVNTYQKKVFGGKKLAANGSRSGNVAPYMVADQEVGSPHLFLSVCLIADIKRGERVFLKKQT